MDFYTLMSKEKANALADEMNAEAKRYGDDETFVAVHDPKGTGQSYIKCLDEDGMQIGRL